MCLCKVQAIYIIAGNAWNDVIVSFLNGLTWMEFELAYYNVIFYGDFSLVLLCANKWLLLPNRNSFLKPYNCLKNRLASTLYYPTKFWYAVKPINQATGILLVKDTYAFIKVSFLSQKETNANMHTHSFSLQYQIFSVALVWSDPYFFCLLLILDNGVMLTPLLEMTCLNLDIK